MKIPFILLFAFMASFLFADENSNNPSLYEESPRVLYKPSPIYPKEALQQELSARVIVKVLFNGKNGRIVTAEIIKSDNDLFNKSALDAAYKILFNQCHQYIFESDPDSIFDHFSVALSYSFKYDQSTSYIDVLPEILHRGKYTLPEEYKKLDYIPPVVVSVLVGEDGKPIEAKLRVEGIKNMHDDLLDAAMRSTFKPAQKDGKAVEAWYDIVFDFNK